MTLITCGSIHQGYEWFSDDSQGGQKIFMCLTARKKFSMPIREWRCQDQVLLHGDQFFSQYTLQQ